MKFKEVKPFIIPVLAIIMLIISLWKLSSYGWDWSLGFITWSAIGFIALAVLIYYGQNKD